MKTLLDKAIEWEVSQGASNKGYSMLMTPTRSTFMAGAAAMAELFARGQGLRVIQDHFKPIDIGLSPFNWVGGCFTQPGVYVIEWPDNSLSVWCTNSAPAVYPCNAVKRHLKIELASIHETDTSPL